MNPIRIFISSPGDVKEERERAVEVIHSLRRRYARKFVLLPVVWEDLPLEPDMSFQQGIDLFLQNPGVDIAVFILWSRLGSPLGPAIRKSDGSPYRSGTEREYDLLTHARRQSLETEGTARPRMIVYTRRDDSSFHARLRGRKTEELAELLEQKQLAESFMRETFHDPESATNISAYHPFDRPATFSQRLRVHLQAMLDEMAGDADEVIWDITRQGPPFLGLDAFQPEHSEIFYGREEEILEARHSLKHQASNGCAFLLLSGASGSGKSSLARAGILPELITHEPDHTAEVWKHLIATPSELGTDPILGLLERIVSKELLPELDGQVPSLTKLAADLARDPAAFFGYAFPKALEAASARLGGSIRIVILIDQLEELFTRDATGSAMRAGFLNFVETLARSGSFWILATVRSDFYQEIQSEPALVRMKEGKGLMDVLPPHPDAIARLIEEPARLAGLVFEEKDGQRLSQRILRDAALQPELLPLLEFVLLELCHAAGPDGVLTHDAYDRLGGVDGALRHKAKQTYEALPPDARRTFGNVMQSMVTLNAADDADTEIEKPVRVHALLEHFPSGSPERAFIHAFIDARLFTTGFSTEKNAPTVTVAHEALLRVWDRMIEWHGENRDFLLARSRIAARMKEGSPLLKGDPLLDSARFFLTTKPDGFTEAQKPWITRAVQQAEDMEKRTTRLRRITFASLLLLAIAASIAAAWAVSARSDAKHQQDLAIQARISAEKALSTERANFAKYQSTSKRTFEAIESYFSAFPEDQVLVMLGEFTGIFKKALSGMDTDKRPPKLLSDLATITEMHALLTVRLAKGQNTPKLLASIQQASRLYAESLDLRKEALKQSPEPADCISVIDQFIGQIRLRNDVPKPFIPIYQSLILKKAEVIRQYFDAIPNDYPNYQQLVVPLRQALEEELSKL